MSLNHDKMKKYLFMYQKFLVVVLVVFLVSIIIERAWLNPGLNMKIFSRLILLLLLYPLVLEIGKRWSKKKVFSSLKQYPTFPKKVIHSFPLVFPPAWQIFKKYFFYLVPLLTFWGILTHIFTLKPEDNLQLLILTFFWIASVWLCSLKGRFSIIVGLIFLMIGPFLLIFKKEQLAEKTAIWAYMFLLTGVIQMAVEYIKARKTHGEAKSK